MTDLAKPLGAASITNTTTNTTADDKRHAKLAKRFLEARNRLNRLIAKRDGRRTPKLVRTANQLRWSDAALRRAIRRMHRRSRRVSRQLRARAVATAAVRATLERIAACESHGDPRAIGGGGAFRGKYQFTYGTWATVGGTGDPAAAPEAEQDRRAAILLQRSGGSAWPVCG